MRVKEKATGRTFIYSTDNTGSICAETGSVSLEGIWWITRNDRGDIIKKESMQFFATIKE